MKKKVNSLIQKHNDTHYLEARTTHHHETEMEVASEFFDEDFIRPLDTQDIYIDRLIEDLKKGCNEID